MEYCRTPTRLISCLYCIISTLLSLIILIRFIISTQTCTCSCHSNLPRIKTLPSVASNRSVGGIDTSNADYNNSQHISSFFKRISIAAMSSGSLSLIFVSIWWIVSCNNGYLIQLLKVF